MRVSVWGGGGYGEGWIREAGQKVVPESYVQTTFSCWPTIKMQICDVFVTVPLDVVWSCYLFFVFCLSLSFGEVDWATS